MSRIIICHIGASVITNIIRSEKSPKDLKADWTGAYERLKRQTAGGQLSEIPEDMVELAAWTVEYVPRHWLENNKHPAALTAEMSSLWSLDLGANDEVIFFVSDTLVGVVSARLVNQILPRLEGLLAPELRFGPGGVVLHEPVVISGLQFEIAGKMDDSKGAGLRHYTEQVLEQYRRARNSGKELVINVTAGYKGMVPFAMLLTTLLGSRLHDVSSPDAGLPIVQCSLTYLFDFATELFTLPALPVTFDRSLFDHYAPIFRRASTGGVSFDEVHEWGIDPYMQSIYLEVVPGSDMYKLSAQGVLLWTLYTAPEMAVLPGG